VVVVCVAMFASKLSEFVEREGLSVEKTGELIQLFNEALVEIGQGILKDSRPRKEAPKSVVGEQRWASKVAEAFAVEKGLSLDDFVGVGKVTKQHMLEHLKSSGKMVSPAVSGNGSPGTSTGKGKGKQKVQCSGLTAKGEPCTRTGTVTPEGAQNCYCFRHADSWRDFETCMSSDSEVEEEEPDLE